MGVPLDMAQMMTAALAACQTPEDVDECAVYLHQLAECATGHAARLRASLGQAVVPPITMGDPSD
jgi:hypothetical protein